MIRLVLMMKLYQYFQCFQVVKIYQQLKQYIKKAIDSLEYILTLNFEPKSQLFYLIKQKLIPKQNQKSIISAIQVYTKLFVFIPQKFHVEIKEFLQSLENINDCLIKQFLAQSLREFLSPNHTFKVFALNLLKKLEYDRFGGVTQNSIDSLISANFDQKEYISQIFPIIFRNIHNPNWKVRFLIIKNFQKILSKSDSFYYSNLMDIFPKFLQDVEYLNQMQALKIIPSIKGFLHRNLILDIYIQKLKCFFEQNKTQLQVLTVKAICELSDKVTVIDIQDCFIPILQNVTISSSMNMDVIAQIFITLNYFQRYMEIQQFENFYKTLKNKLQTSEDWKIRLNFANIMNDLILGQKNSFNQGNMKVLDILLQDKVKQIRKQAIQTLINITSKLESFDIENKIIPFIQKYKKFENYQFKMNYFLAITKISSFLTYNQLEKELKTFLDETKNPNPNIRLIVFFCLGKMLLGKHELTVKSVFIQAQINLKQDENEFNRQLASQVTNDDLKGGLEKLINYYQKDELDNQFSLKLFYNQS